MILLVLSLLPMLPPSLHVIPPEVAPYIKRWRKEPELIRWYVSHPARDWATFFGDGSVSARARQRVWQFKPKIR